MVLRNQLADDRCRLAGLGLIVFGDQANLLPEHPTVRIDLLHRQRGSLVGRLTETGTRSGQRRKFADRNFLIGHQPGRGKDDTGCEGENLGEFE